jgi:hypothetical protein
MNCWAITVIFCLLLQPTVVFPGTWHSTIQSQKNPVHTLILHLSPIVILSSRLNSVFSSGFMFLQLTHARGNKSTQAYSVLEGTATNENILTICLSVVNGILQHVIISVKRKCCAFTPYHLQVTYQESNHAFSCIQVIFNCSNRNLD